MAAPVKRNWLSEIKTTIQGRPTAAVLYGVPGVGKTSLGASIPGGVLMYCEGEDGITTLKSAGQVARDYPQLGPIKSWTDAMDVLDTLALEDHPHKCLEIDTFGGFETLLHQHVTATEYGGSRAKFMNYHNGFDVSLSFWRAFLGKLDRLRDEKQMSIMLLGHAKVDDFKNPEGADYDQWLPQCHEKTWGITHQWADMVLFANYVIAVDEDGKGKGGSSRFFYTQFHPAYSAKNRYGLPSQISMGNSAAEAWGNLTKELQAAKEF